METIKSIENYKQQYKDALENPEQYWASVAKNLHWQKNWNQVQSGNFTDLNIQWFSGAETNLSFNCLDRHLPRLANKPALYFVANDPKKDVESLSYKELHERVCTMANVFESMGVKKGDVICFYMGMVPELLIGILAATRIGAIHSVVFGGFSAQSLAGRIQDCQAKFLVTNDGGFRGDKTIGLKSIADEALAQCPSIKKVLVHKRTAQKVEWKEGRDFWLHDLLPKVKIEHKAVWVDSEHPLFILYTSGSTGKPKGLLHTTGGYMVYAFQTFRNVFQMESKPESKEIFWCTADIGWITGHTYLTYGPLLNGVSTVMFEGVPTYPDAGRFWAEVDRLQVTHFYTAPTAIRALEAAGVEHVKKHKLTSLKVLGSVGEPINEEAWEWYNKNIGHSRCPIVDTWWQTETGGIMISTLAGVTPSVPAHATLPLPGIVPVLMDPNGKEIPFNDSTEVEGNLCIKFPWPGMARTVYGDHERFRQTYFSAYKNYYFTGDGAKRTVENYYRITGRVDDVINVSGHRLGTAEIEDAINDHPDVVESAVVGYPHKIKGQGIYAYCICTSMPVDPEKTRKEILATVNKIIGPIAKPDLIQFVPGLPKTRSGKIMRRILRKVAEGELSSLGDVTTLLNPEVVEQIIQGRLS